MKYCFVVLIGVLQIGLIHAQQQFEGIVFQDQIYTPNVRSVQLNLVGLPYTFPIFELGKPQGLELSFDDLDGDAKYYSYSLVHCDMNWQPSQLMFHEYATGFEYEELLNYTNSVGARIPYTHYRLMIPNRNTEITKSGNYLLVVFANSDPTTPALTRRFVVIEPPVIAVKMIKVRPSEVSKINTHQEIRWNIDSKELRLRDPKTELVCSLLQNGRWDTSINGITSRREQGTLLWFDYLNLTVFPAGKEFRSIDLRSTQFRGEGVFALEKVDGHIRAVARLDKPRTHDPYFTKVDVNGQFVISTSDYRNVDSGSRSDYLECVFTLETGKEFEESIFVFGGLSDWRLKEEFRLTYEPQYKSYMGKVFLKQGFYDYVYAIGNSDGSADETTLEGNWFESTNDYTLIVYYRPFGTRYDRAIAATSFAWGQ